MAKHNLISIDLEKNVFQIFCITKTQKVTLNKSIRRDELAIFIAQQEPTTIAMEACYSSHYWARRFEALGHKVLLLPAQQVKPFVRGNKSNLNDAIAIAKAALRPNIKAAPVKNLQQQEIQALHRLRERYVSPPTY
jgi:transposase